MGYVVIVEIMLVRSQVRPNNLFTYPLTTTPNNLRLNLPSPLIYQHYEDQDFGRFNY